MRLLLLLPLVFMLGGCSSMLNVEVQNDGPGPVTVAFRFVDDGRQVERLVEVPERGTKIEGLWYGTEPASLEIEAKWPTTVRRQIFARKAILGALQVSRSDNGIRGLSVSPEGIRWTKPTIWVRLQSPTMIPVFLFFFVFALSRWIRWRIRSAPPSTAPR